MTKITLQQLGLSARACNSLRNVGIETLDQIPRDMGRLRRIKNLGEVTCLEILRVVERFSPSDHLRLVAHDIETAWWQANRPIVSAALKSGATVAITVTTIRPGLTGPNPKEHT